MTEERMKQILRNAIIAYEFELDQQDYESEEELHRVLLNEFGMTDDEYRLLKGSFVRGYYEGAD